MTTGMNPELESKRSFIYRQLADGLKQSKSTEVSTALVDLSLLPRIGMRGSRSTEYLNAIKMPIPEKPNLAVSADTGELVLRLGVNSYWVLASLADAGVTLTSLTEKSLPEQDCYQAYCQHSHAWFAITGDLQAQIMAKICGVDLREESFPLGAIVQTFAAGVSVIIVHHQYEQTSLFSVFCDTTFAEYLWKTLGDAMAEFEGQVIGFNELV